MPVYAYTGNDRNGQQVRGTIAADSPRAGRDTLRVDGVRVASLKPLKTDSGSWWNSIGRRRARGQWGGAAHEMSMLLRAGIAVDDALSTLANQYGGAFGDALTHLHDQVTAGRSLAEAMDDQPDVFDPAAIRLVEVGENAGTLETVLEELAEFRQRMSEFSDKVANALMYPAFLFVFGIAAMIFLMTWVLPPLLENLQETLTEIPLPTRIAQAISNVLVYYGFQLAIAGVLIGAGVGWALTRPSGRRWKDRVILNLPLLGPLLTKQLVARISMIIGLLLRSGIPLNQAVELAARSIQNQTVRDTLAQAGQDLAAGRDLASCLTQSKIFPPLAVRVFSVGQDSGQLDEMLVRLGDDYNRQVQAASTRLTALLEPVLILVMATMVGFLLLATILPILQAGQTV